MTKPMMDLRELVEKSGDADLLREMIGFAAERLMELEVGDQTGAACGEKSPERRAQRNGYRDRDWQTRAGNVELRIPKLRRGSYFPSFLEPRRAVETALTAVIREAHVHGVSTRAMDDLVQAMGGTGIFKSQVSRLCEEIDERVDAFLTRPIEGEWPYLWIDATCLKVRQGGRIVSVAVTIAVGVNTDGRREVLGMAIGPSEAEPFWTDFLRGLVRRGLTGVKLVISDAHEGIKAATARVLNTTWQRCRVHFQRNALAHAGKSSRRVVSAFIATAFAQPDHGAARTQWRLVADQMRSKLPKLATLMDGAEEDVLACMTFPRQHRAKLHSTNPIERLNGEIKRRTDVVGIFPDEAAIRRLVGAILMEQTEEWTVQRGRYMTLETLAPVCDDAIISLPACRADRPISSARRHPSGSPRATPRGGTRSAFRVRHDPPPCPPGAVSCTGGVTDMAQKKAAAHPVWMAAAGRDRSRGIRTRRSGEADPEGLGQVTVSPRMGQETPLAGRRDRLGQVRKAEAGTSRHRA